MITQEQINAWERKHLEEMSQVSQEIYPLEGREECDRKDLDDRLILFMNDVLIPMINTLGFAIQNYPLVCAEMDKENILEEDKLSLPDLFDYLCAMSQFGRYNVLSEIPYNELLLSSVRDNDRDRFIGIVNEYSLDLSDICLKVGYTNTLLLIFQDAISVFFKQILEDAMSEEELQAILKKADAYRERAERVYGAEALQRLFINDKMKFILLKCTKLEIKPLEDIFYDLYLSIMLLWYAAGELIGYNFSEDELNIVKPIINNKEYLDIIEDVKRLSYIIFDFPGGGLYALEDTEELDSIKENLQLN